MNSFIGLYLATIALLLIDSFSEVTILNKVTTIYDRSPKLRIRGTGLDADNIILDISATGLFKLV